MQPGSTGQRRPFWRVWGQSDGKGTLPYRLFRNCVTEKPKVRPVSEARHADPPKDAAAGPAKRL